MKVWTITDMPKQKTCIESKWIYKLKADADRKPAKYKICLVPLGFNQEKRIDYNDTKLQYKKEFLLITSV